jgi:hypothetical protein
LRRDLDTVPAKEGSGDVGRRRRHAPIMWCIPDSVKNPIRSNFPAAGTRSVLVGPRESA